MEDAMRNRSNARYNVWSAVVSTLMLCGAQSAQAKLSPAPDDDGLTDPEDEAEVNALNEALEGPEEGQSWEAWEAEVQAAYNALHDIEPAGQTQSTSPGPVVAPIVLDMCVSPFNAWVESSSNKIVSEALANAGERAELEDEVEYAMEWLLMAQSAGSALRIDSVALDSLTCSGGCSMTYIECLEAGLGVDYCKRHHLTCSRQPESSVSFTVDFSVLAINVPQIGGAFAIANGTISIEGSGYYRESEMVGYININTGETPIERERCFDVIDYDISGINPLILATISDRIEATIYGTELCLPGF
jgi:hypothetical protein